MNLYTRIFVVALALGLSGIGFVRATHAALIFSEDFNSLSGSHFLSASSERAAGSYMNKVSIPGWVLEGNSAEILGFEWSKNNRAVVLNEGKEGITDPLNGISREIEGLLPGVPYILSFEYWGDNITAAYAFSFEINGVTTPIAAAHSGPNTGTFHTQSFTFTPLTDSTILRFTEKSLTQASPIIDNITIAALPEPSTLVIFTLGGLGLLLSNRRRQCPIGTR